MKEAIIQGQKQSQSLCVRNKILRTNQSCLNTHKHFLMKIWSKIVINGIQSFLPVNYTYNIPSSERFHMEYAEISQLGEGGISYFKE
jgi:hypothetical protein